MFRNSCPGGQGSCHWHFDIHLLAETSSLGIGSKSCTSLHRSTMQHPCWSWLATVSAPSDQCQEGQSAGSQTLLCRMAEATGSKGTAGW